MSAVLGLTCRLALFLPAFLALSIAVSPALAATVVSIGDGDTLKVTDNGQRVTIRLACIDAPETSQVPCGLQSRQALRSLLPVGTKVRVSPQTIDKYGRTVAEIYRGDQLINLEMVRTGQAYAYRKYLSNCDQAAYLGAESAAEQRRLGVWEVPGGIDRPWYWRHRRR